MSSLPAPDSLNGDGVYDGDDEWRGGDVTDDDGDGNKSPRWIDGDDEG